MILALLMLYGTTSQTKLLNFKSNFLIENETFQFQTLQRSLQNLFLPILELKLHHIMLVIEVIQSTSSEIVNDSFNIYQ
jgi:ABC-type antimicrobial peptide transport system permease subunit